MYTLALRLQFFTSTMYVSLAAPDVRLQLCVQRHRAWDVYIAVAGTGLYQDISTACIMNNVRWTVTSTGEPPDNVCRSFKLSLDRHAALVHFLLAHGMEEKPQSVQTNPLRHSSITYRHFQRPSMSMEF